MAKFKCISSAKKVYIELCNMHDDIELYNKPFWLDAVCGQDNWDAVVVLVDDEIVAAVPYFIKKKYGMNFITQPQLTQHMTIWQKPIQETKKEKKLEYEFEIINSIAEGLLEVGVDYILQTYSPSLDNWEPFYWNGFKQETLYTFIIKKGKNFEEIQQQLSSNLKRDIKKAGKTAKIEETRDLEEFYKYNCMSFERQEKQNPISIELLERIYRACSENDACKMLKVVDDENEIHCVGFYVFDKNNVYEILLGTNPQKRSSNFKSLMTLHMIKFACETQRNFDFEGSMIKSIANYNRRFGADLVPYYKVWKVSANNPIKKKALQLKMMG